MRRRVCGRRGLALLAALALAACGRGAAPPATGAAGAGGAGGAAGRDVASGAAAPAPRQEWGLVFAATLLQEGAPWLTVPPGGVVRIGPAPAVLRLDLTGWVEPSALAPFVQVPPGARVEWGRGRLEVTLPPGAGDWVVGIRAGAPLPWGGTTAADLRYRIIREAGARVTYTLGDRLLALPSPGRGAFAVAGPVDLRLQFERPADRASVTAALLQATGAVPALQPVAMDWENDQILRLRLGAPAGTRLTLSLEGARDRDGFPFAAVPLPLWWQAPARLWSMEPDGAKPTVLAQFGHGVAAASVSPEGYGVAYVEPTGDGQPDRPLGALWLLDRRTGSRREVGLAVEVETPPAWADGQRLLAPGADGLYLVDGERAGALVRLAPPSPAWALSPDGRWLAYLTGPDAGPLDLVITGFPSGVARIKRLGLPAPAPGVAVAVAWRPDGRWLAVLYGSRSLLLEADGDGRRELALRGQGRALAWAPGGEYLAAGEQVLALPAGQAVAQLPGATAAHWSPDGARLLWQAGGRVRTYTPGSGQVLDLDRGLAVGWLPTGHLLLVRE